MSVVILDWIANSLGSGGFLVSDNRDVTLRDYADALEF